MVRLDQDAPNAPARALDGGVADSNDLRTYVTISRQHASDVRQRQILVRLDDGPEATLVYGQTVTVEVRPGAHVLRANTAICLVTHLDHRTGPLVEAAAARGSGEPQ